MNRPPPAPFDSDDERPPMHGTVEGQLARKADLRVIGGVHEPARPDIIAAIKHWHKGLRDRVTGDIRIWTTLIIVHVDSGRVIRQLDVRPDEDDIDLAIDINSVIDGHGRPLANNTQITQNYQVDCYFEGRTDPQGNVMAEVHPAANMDGLGYKATQNSPFMRQRGTPQDFSQQDFRHREQNQQMTMGLVHLTVHELHDQLRESRAENREWRTREKEIQERERLLKKEEYDHELAMLREKGRIKRNMFIVAKVGRYLPIIASRLDERLFGLSQLTSEEKEQKSSAVIKSILSKLSNDAEGQARFEEVAAILNLTDDDKSAIKDLGVMMWLENEQKKMKREAELAQKGGFAGLGDDIKGILDDAKTPKERQLGDGSK